ncbi:MAG: YtxH domain-containing protein [Firmicutes bacterium]|nr:YtxH domain-containing protein [Bacillota bacterium]
MASRLSALRESAMPAVEQLEDRVSRLFREAQERNMLTYALIAVTGFTLGMLTGILVAPASGAETRRNISKRASEAAESARKMAKRRAAEMAEEAEKIA